MIAATTADEVTTLKQLRNDAERWARQIKRIRERGERAQRRLAEFHRLGGQMEFNRENWFTRELLIKIMADVPQDRWQSAIESLKRDFNVS